MKNLRLSIIVLVLSSFLGCDKVTSAQDGIVRYCSGTSIGDQAHCLKDYMSLVKDVSIRFAQIRSTLPPAAQAYVQALMMQKNNDCITARKDMKQLSDEGQSLKAELQQPGDEKKPAGFIAYNLVAKDANTFASCFSYIAGTLKISQPSASGAMEQNAQKIFTVGNAMATSNH